jgi:hypothetical protein
VIAIACAPVKFENANQRRRQVQVIRVARIGQSRPLGQPNFRNAPFRGPCCSQPPSRLIVFSEGAAIPITRPRALDPIEWRLTEFRHIEFADLHHGARLDEYGQQPVTQRTGRGWLAQELVNAEADRLVYAPEMRISCE